MRRLAVAILFGCLLTYPGFGATNWTVVGWNNLGMHCMDDDFSVFSILPPYNTIHAQLIAGTNGVARLVTNTTAFTVLYQGTGDPSGSTNTTSIGKGNFWQYAGALFGTNLPADAGLPVPGPSYYMPGIANTPQAMSWETSSAWFAAYGIPITPYDDAQRKNAYPLMRLVAKQNSTVLTNLDIVLPVSDEMDCRLCHGSGTITNARPVAGWVWDPYPSRDHRLNVLRLHDERQVANPTYAAALASNHFHSAGLYATVTVSNRPILCAACHSSEALPESGILNIKPLTEAVHGRHAGVTDPTNGQTLDMASNRSACYRCHPGSETRCLRGAMGKSVAADGSMAMQCQGCHGSMSVVGASGRKGWLDEPTCQNCHVGNATNSYGVIRFTSVYTNSVRRAAADQTFATNPNTPANGVSLYRFSRGHGGLYCSACHGSTHAEFPASHANDNIASRQIQGHEGVVAACTRCHGGNPSTTTGGPHGMHPVGQDWVGEHDSVGGNETPCKACHGADLRGTVLSLSQSDQTLIAKSLDGTVKSITNNAWRGFTIGCWTCHMGPNDKDSNTNPPPVASNLSTSTAVNVSVGITLKATDADPLTYRIVSQPAHGSVALTASNATYFPENNFTGTVRFTFAAWDGYRNSNLATGSVTVAGGVTYALNPPGPVSFDELGGAASVTVNVTGLGQWTAASNHRWITILSGGNTNVTGDLLYYVERNTNTLPRYGSITIAGQTLYVSQGAAQTDANGDGLPDWWQVTYFGSTTSSNAAPGTDFLGNGFSNLQKYLAGLNPTNPVSLLRINSLTPAGAAFQISFPTVSNKFYQVQRRDDLLAGAWAGFTNAIIGTGGSVLIQDGDAVTQPKRFYRILLVP